MLYETYLRYVCTAVSSYKNLQMQNFKIRRKFGIIMLSAWVFAACQNEKAELSSAQQSPRAIDWAGANSGQSFKLGDEVLVKFTSAKIGSRPIEVMVDDSLLAKVNPGDDFEMPLSTKGFTLGEHLIKVIAYPEADKPEVRNFVFNLNSNFAAVDYDIEILEKLPHNTTWYTQGLEFYGGKLFESTGLNGSSKIIEVNMQNSTEKRSKDLDKKYFGEGITILNDKIYQLTYKAQTCFVYDLNTFEQINEFKYNILEGWGLTNNGKELLMSDGTEKIYFIEPETFQVKRSIKVHNEEGDIQFLNELEMINDTLYANVYQYDLIVQIDPNTGMVLGHIYMAELRNAFEPNLEMDVLNGIAKDSSKDGFYVTGKKWPFMFRVKLKERKVA